MLKWTVVKRDAFQNQDPSRRSSVGVCTTASTTTTAATAASSAQKSKRRRSSTGRRRSSTGKRNSLCLDLNKENQFTSTPIKDEAFQADAFRDVSNLTPKDAARPRRRSECKKALYSPPKKKKPCLDKEHISLSQDFLLNLDNTNYFKPFEAVDSHIEGSYLPSVVNNKDLPVLNDCGCQFAKTPITKRYAPTLPTYALDYSPTPAVCNSNLCQPKIDHVNDFLQRISLITSPEELKLRLPGYRPKKKQQPLCQSPNLVKRFVDRRFGNRLHKKADDSSFINDLSLDKIVDAILDTSENEEDDNECNRTTEENLINEQQVANTSGSSIITTSTDSGFRSSTTEMSIAKSNEDLPHLTNDTCIERTMINLDGTYNERCVDVVNNRKRPSTDELSDDSIVNADGCSVAASGPKLKRQKCIRQKKPSMLVKKDDDKVSVNDHSFDSDSVDVPELVEVESTYVVTSPEILRPNSACQTIAIKEPFRENEERGSIDFEVQYKQDELSVTIFRCKELRRHNGQPVNAYIKVALSERYIDGRRKHRGTLQRTAVQPESTAPYFEHTFRVPLQPDDVHFKVLYVEVWHRDRTTRRSEFLGCTSFAIKDALKQKITGTHKLLSQWSDAQATTQPASVASASVIVNNNNNNNKNNNNHLGDSSRDVAVAIMSETALHTSIDELIAEENVDGLNDLKKNKAALSEQQRHADENLFLRYLELDPIEGPEAGPALAQRKASGLKTTGRTPFTMSRVLRRMPKSGFGFSVVWTHPPRIERVERNLPAEKAGIQPGDYLIFVDKHNVVMMPEIEILNLIRSMGSQLTLETFRRDPNRNGSVVVVDEKPSTQQRVTSLSGLSGVGLGMDRATFDSGSTTGLPLVASSMTSVIAPAAPASTATPRRPSTVCSTNTASVEYSRKKLHLPQVTFSSERPTSSADEARRKAMYQIIAREQQYTISMQFAVTRYVQSSLERKDLIGQQEHRTLFQNCEELLRISEEIIDHLIQVDGDYHTGSLIKIYASKLNEITTAYKRYCSGIKKADCVLANLMKNQDFSQFTTTPAIPRRRPDLTSFIHKPLEHYREILKLFNVILTNTKTNQTDEYNIVNHIVHELQGNYREMTSQVGLMEPAGEGRPLLSVQDLETRLVFTKCKPFVLSKPGRQWIFGGDLSRVEGRTVRQYWALLFSDILLFAKVSRDRVLFILEEPLPLANISDMFFNVRKKENEFRIIVEPGGANNRNTASSPTVHCGPDLSRTPRKHLSKRCIILRTPTVELKAVWQNLLQRQIFHISTSGTDGSTYSSPVESPDCQPITSSVVTLQSAESLSRQQQHSSHHQLPQRHHHQHHQASNLRYTNNVHNINNNNEQHHESRKLMEELIEHKCKQLEKSSSSSKSNAIHLEQWMKGQFNNDSMNNNPEDTDPEELDDDIELWTEEQMRKRSEELKLINPVGDVRVESRCEEVLLDDDQSPSRSTNTTESQVTVRSSPLVPETMSMCKTCHKTCYQQPTSAPLTNGYKPHGNVVSQNVGAEQIEEDDEWRPLMLMGLSAVNPAVSLVKLDPFSMPVPQISILPSTPTPDSAASKECNCQCTPTKTFELVLNKSYDNSPDDSPMNETDEQPYHSLHSSNLTLRRFGTVSSLERFGSEEEAYDVREDSDNSEENDIKTTELSGIDNEGFNNTLMTWTARAGSFVAAKMAFLEKLPEYLKTEIAMNGDDIQEEETSGGTSGEEIWGTPTSGGELDDPLSSPQYDDHNSPNGGGSLSSNEDTELMMDELLMTPPVTSSNIRGLLPRRTLEPLMEEEFSDTYTTSSSSSPTPTEPSESPEQGNEIGDAADECLSVVATHLPPSSARRSGTTTRGSNGSSTRLGVASLRSTSTTPPATISTIIRQAVAATAAATAMTKTPAACNYANQHSDIVCNNISNSITSQSLQEVQQATAMFIKRSESYQKIIEAEDDSVGFFTRFRNRPSMKYVTRIAHSDSFSLEFFNVRRERKIYETFPGGKHLIKVFSREGDHSDDVPTSYSEKPDVLQRIKQERQLDRRFWKQLSKRRNSNSPNRQTNSTNSSTMSPSPILTKPETTQTGNKKTNQVQLSA